MMKNLYRNVASSRAEAWLKKNAIPMVLFVVLLLASAPLFHSQMFLTHDFTHGARVTEMSLALKDGHFPVRWSKNFGYGYGMPLFQFYGPLPFYLGSVFFLVVGNLLFSVKLLFFISNLFTLIGSYLLGKSIFKTKFAGLIVSLAITLVPYRFLNLYIRGALNELWGMMAMIWIIYSLRLVITRSKNGWVLLTSSLIVLFLSHNITTLIFAPFFLLALIVMVINSIQAGELKKSYLKSIFNQVVVAVVLALGTSAFYLFPAYLEKELTQFRQYILADYFDFRVHFLYLKQFIRPSWGFGGSVLGPDDPISFFLGFGQIGGLFFAGILMIKQLLLKKKLKKLFLPISLFLLLGISLVLTTHYSLFIWEMIPLLNYVQFPWRFMSLAAIFLGLVIGWMISQLPQKSFYYQSLSALLILLLLANLGFVKPEGYLENADDVYYQNQEKIQSSMSEYLPDYIPSNLSTNIPPDLLLLIDEQLEGEHQVLANKTHYKQISFLLNKPQTVSINIANYPGWNLYLNDLQLDYATSDIGTIQADIPAGQNILQLKFESTNLRQVSDYVSLLSLAVLLFYVSKLVIKQPQHAARN